MEKGALYGPGMRVLTVGDGDLSFSLLWRACESTVSWPLLIYPAQSSMPRMGQKRWHQLLPNLISWAPRCFIQWTRRD